MCEAENDALLVPNALSDTGDNANYLKLGLRDFARLFGTSVDDIPEDCRALIELYDFRYRMLDGDERDKVLSDVLKTTDSERLTTAGREGKGRWERGWLENLNSFLEHGRDLSHLVPKYIRKGEPLRLDQNYIVAPNPNFEFNWYEIFRLWLFRTYLNNVARVYEFGCGSGFNLAALATLYPNKETYGLDWVDSSRGIVDELARTYGWNMKGLLFDFFNPDERVKIADNSAVLTIGALEQTGRDHESFLQYLLRYPPELCIHIEPVLEWYDKNNLNDYAAIRFHKKRKYWEGFPDRLIQLENEGKVEILKAKRSYFGSLFIEGYSQLIWRPIS